MSGKPKDDNDVVRMYGHAAYNPTRDIVPFDPEAPEEEPEHAVDLRAQGKGPESCPQKPQKCSSADSEVVGAMPPSASEGNFGVFGGELEGSERPVHGAMPGSSGASQRVMDLGAQGRSPESCPQKPQKCSSADSEVVGAMPPSASEGNFGVFGGESGAEAAEWEPPVAFEGFSLPTFPEAVLPPWLHSFVVELSVALQTPPDLAGLMVLAACAAALAKRVRVLIKPGWMEPLNLYLLCALPPANRKSSVVSAVSAPIIEFENQEVERMAPLVEEARSRRRIQEAQLHQTEAEAAKAKDRDEATDAMDRANTQAHELAKMEAPTPPCLIVDDITSEALASELAKQGGRVAVLSAEGGLFDTIAGRYSHGTPNLDVFLKGHSGQDDLRVHRQSRVEIVSRPALTMALAVQPEVVMALFGKPGFRGRGLLGRFLYSIPISTIGRRQIDPAPVSALTQERYRQNLLRLLRIPPGGDDGQPREHVLEVTNEARICLFEVASALEPRLGEFGDLAGMGDFGGKLVGSVARLAAILSIAEHVADERPWEHPVSGERMARAVRLGEYFIEHAQAAYSLMGADQAVHDAKHVLRWIERGGLVRFSYREAQQATKSSLESSERLQRALARLVEHGYIREPSGAQAAGGLRGRGRPPKPTYEVNPYFLRSSPPSKGQPQPCDERAGVRAASLATDERNS